MRSVFGLTLATVMLGTPSFRAADADAQAVNHQLRALAQYPKPVREAILEMLNHPELLKKVEDGAALKKMLKGEKPHVQEAARLVAQHPEVVKLLKDHPTAFALAARAYADHKKKTVAEMDQEDKDNDKAADEWAQRLEADPDATKQLREAADAFARTPGGAVVDAGITPSKDAVTVHTQPSPGFVKYVMSNADRYPALSNAMTSQWLSSKNPAAYDRAFHHWWGNYEHHFHHSLLHPDAHRAHRLGELARFDRHHAHVNPAQRYANFQRHAHDHPHLAKLPPHDPKNHTARAGLHHKPHHKDAHPPGKGPHNKAGGRNPNHAVHRKPGSHQHQMHHAKAGHHHHAAHHGGKKK